MSPTDSSQAYVEIMRRLLIIGSLLSMMLVPLVSWQGVASSSEVSRVLRACEADGVVISKAMESFEDTNPGTLMTQAALLAKIRGGPFLKKWPVYPGYFRFTMDRGVLEIQAAQPGSA
ncbi:MAG: hypothetical protein ACRDVC_11175 [Acidimicrobiales bacterium]